MKSIPQLANYIDMPLPILIGILSRIIPGNNDYSKSLISKFMDEISPEVFEAFPPGYHPLTELESLSKLKNNSSSQLEEPQGERPTLFNSFVVIICLNGVVMFFL